MCLKNPISINELTQASRPLRNILDQIRVQCTLCAQTDLQRGNFVDHINKICPKSVVPCQAADIKCPWQGPRDELQSHISTCVFEPLRPVLSSLIAQNRQLIDQVQKHDNEIKKLIQQMHQLQPKGAYRLDHYCKSDLLISIAKDAQNYNKEEKKYDEEEFTEVMQI
ncbi:unnamed protein product [Rotaria sp. Silwood2]|nr:unnamed protein product [Rotaria sp. Silwood2]